MIIFIVIVSNAVITCSTVIRKLCFRPECLSVSCSSEDYHYIPVKWLSFTKLS